MRRNYDFTEGNILGQLVVFSIPIMLTNLLQVSYQFIDSYGWYLIGANALGAVAVAVYHICRFIFIIGINNATLTILSQQKGKQMK